MTVLDGNSMGLQRSMSLFMHPLLVLPPLPPPLPPPLRPPWPPAPARRPRALPPPPPASLAPGAQEGAGAHHAPVALPLPGLVFRALLFPSPGARNPTLAAAKLVTPSHMPATMRCPAKNRPCILATQAAACSACLNLTVTTPSGCCLNTRTCPPSTWTWPQEASSSPELAKGTPRCAAATPSDTASPHPRPF